MTKSGKCLCGAVTYQGIGEHKGVQVCHCTDCVRWTGGPFMALQFSGGADIEGPVNWFKSSEWGERGSCATCGTAMFWRLQDGRMLTITAGSLDDKESLAPIAEHIFIEQKNDYYEFADDAPRLTGAELMARAQGETE